MKFKEVTEVGTSFVRCCAIEIRNPEGEVPAVRFIEERVTNLAGRRISEIEAQPLIIKHDSTIAIDLYDPDTLEKLGTTISMDELYRGIASAYLFFAKQREILNAEQIAAAEAVRQELASRLPPA